MSGGLLRATPSSASVCPRHPTAEGLSGQWHVAPKPTGKDSLFSTCRTSAPSTMCPGQKPRSHSIAGASRAGLPVVITSYEIVIADSKALQRYNWRYVVVDEGHRLKNNNCRLLRELNMLPTSNKLLLTGGSLGASPVCTKLW